MLALQTIAPSTRAQVFIESRVPPLKRVTGVAVGEEGDHVLKKFDYVVRVTIIFTGGLGWV